MLGLCFQKLYKSNDLSFGLYLIRNINWMKPYLNYIFFENIN